MTNSTDKPNKDSKETEKKKKAKGPIRFEAIVPTVIILALIAGYFSLFFDSNLRQGLEWTGTYVHGAEVNIGKIRTSFITADFAVYDLQITNKNKPEENLLQVGRIRLKLLWDALLRAKFVVDDATIENIQTGVPRKRPGKVLPKDTAAGKSQTVREIETAALDKAKSDFGGNVLGDVASILEGTNGGEQLKKIQADLKAEGKIKELEKTLKEKEQAWNKRLKELPTPKELDGLVNRAKSLKFDTNNPAEFLKNVEQLKKIAAEADGKIKLVDKTGKELDADTKAFDAALKEIDALAKKDLLDLQKRLKIPSLNMGDFSKSLFGSMLAKRLGSMEKYLVLAQEYMPPKKSKEEKAQAAPELVPKERGQGRNFRFPITKGYPLFWLKHAAISSEPTESEYSGRVSGEVKHLSTNPVLLGIPATIKIEGDFPKQDIQGFSTNIVIDHTTSIPVETFTTRIESYPVGGNVLADSDDVKLAINKALGSTDIDGSRKNKMLDVTIKNSFKNIDYQVKAKSSVMQEVLTGVTKDLAVVNVRAKATGPLDGLSWDIYSNLGDELAKGFKKQLDYKIKEAQAKLKAFVDERINKERAKLQGQADSLKGELNKTINDTKNKVAQAKNSVEKDANQRTKQLENSKKKELEKAGKKLLKGLGL